MADRSLPNFFIIGAPKCGTTSLSEYLRSHPNVFFTDPKEPHYLASDLPRKQIVSNDDEYLALYAEATEQHQAIGEGSTWGLYSKVAVDKILEFNPDARFIVMLRNPIEQVQSMHSYWYSIGREDQSSFDKAWDLQESRSAGENLPRGREVREFYQYAEIAKYGKQIERLLNKVSAEQVKIVLLEDLKQNPDQTYQEILNFLDLPTLSEPLQFDVHNENKVVRSRFLAFAVRRIPVLLEPFVKAFKRITGIKNIGIMPMLNKLDMRFNHKPGKREAIDDAMKARLIETFRADVQLLEKQLGRDLRHWLQ